MQKIGLLGGLSWVSTAEYYRRLNELMQDKMGGVNIPSFATTELHCIATINRSLEAIDGA